MIKKCNQCNKEFKISKTEIVFCSIKCREINIKGKKKYNLRNKEKIRLLQQKYYQKNKNKIKNRSKKYRKEHKQYLKIWKRKYHQRNKIKHLLKMKQYYQEHKEEAKEYAKIYATKNRKRLNEYFRKYKNNPINKLVAYCRTRIWYVLKNNKKDAHIEKLLGCTIKFLKSYIENQFAEDMSWDNWGTGKNGKGMSEWQIDHIRPCCSFDLTKPVEQYKCFSYKNLRPLWAKENISKNGKY